MLEVGNAGLTLAEQRTHFALWCMVKSPLLIGSDVRSISNDSLAILTNKALIAVNQDPLGIQAVKLAAFPASQLLPVSPRLHDRLAALERHTQAAQWSAAISPAAAAPPITPCDLPVDLAVVGSQQWNILGATIRQGTQCLTAPNTPDGLVSIAACSGVAAQNWQVGGLNATVSQVKTVGGGDCLAYDGVTLHTEACHEEPADCHVTRCANSLLVHQLW